MEDNLLPQHNGACIHCKANEGLPGFPMHLCTECRTALNRYPIPKWIWAFTAVIIILMIAGLVRIPGYLDASIHLRRAEKANKQHKYITAKKEATIVLKHFPDLLEANAYSVIASCYTRDMENIQTTYGKLENKGIEDKELYNEITVALDFVQQALPIDTALIKRTASMINAPLPAQEHFMDSLDAGVRETDRALFGLILANHLYEKEEYKTCTAILNKIRAFSPENYSAVLLLIAVKRNTADYKAALTLIDSMLTTNPEDVIVISQKAKVLLKMKQDKEAAALAQQAMLLAPANTASLEAQALVYYLTGKKQQSNKLLTDIRARESATDGDSSISDRLAKVLDGTVSYR